MHMKTKYTLFRRGGILLFPRHAPPASKQVCAPRDETEASSLINARNEAHRQPVLNLHLARAYLTASDPAFVERTWQTVMEQLQAEARTAAASVTQACSSRPPLTACGTRN